MTNAPATTSQPRNTRLARRSPGRSAAGDGVNVVDRERGLAPALAAVARAEHLAAARDAVHLRRVARVQRQRHHRRARLHVVIEACPRAAEVRAAIERAVLAARRGTERGVE